MANVMQHHIDFYPRPVSHAPSPFGFGFGLGTGRSTPAFHPFASSTSMNQQPSVSRPQKRRHEPEDDSEPIRDHSMDPPERQVRGLLKRPRVTPAVDGSSKEQSTSKENKAPNSSSDDEVDIGVLLASLPTQSLLPLLSSLLKAHPSLKPSVLSLIPRPTLETAIQAVSQSAKKLSEAYPYSSSPIPPLAASFGFGRPHNPPTNTQASHGTMRDSYVISRIKPQVAEFVAACMSYLPYFSCIPPSSPSTTPSTTTMPLLNKDLHPSETFLYLSAIMNHVISQPPLAQSLLVPLLLPRVTQEWRMWVNKVDRVVNEEAGMYGREVVESWERGLDEMASAKLGEEGSNAMRDVRDTWVAKVGWLVGRTIPHPMDV